MKLYLSIVTSVKELECLTVYNALSKSNYNFKKVNIISDNVTKNSYVGITIC